MLASIFSKVTTSLGKTYVYAGLLPAGVFIAVLVSYFASGPVIFDLTKSLLTRADSWNSVAVLGAVWLVLAFLFYAIRLPVFDLFQRIPTGPIGRRMVFRRMRKRLRAVRTRIEIEWRATSLLWLTKLNLDRSKIGAIPHWIAGPSYEQALEESRCGRETLTAIDRTVGDVVNLTVSSSDKIGNGIFSLYYLASRKHESTVESAIETEMCKWRFAASSAQAQEVLDSVEQDLKRKFTKAFLLCRRFGEGPYIYPTELGNRISALDDYAQDRYGIDTATMWDRLWWVLPSDAKSEVGDARLALETLINLAFALLLAGLALSGGEIATCGREIGAASSCYGIRFAAFVIAALVLAMLAYRGATFAMEIFSIKTTTLIDMYRLTLLERLGFQVKSVGEELKLYAELKGFFVQASKLDETRGITIPHKAESKDGKTKEEDKSDRTSEKRSETPKPEDDKGGETNSEGV